jgi:ParB family chromosome partitioning protein
MLKEIDYKELVENDYNPRKRFDDAEMVELTESIKKVGLLEPLVVRKKKDGKYEVVCGIRRYKALSNIHNGKKIPVNIVDVDDHQALILSFTENFERADFSPIEEARFFAKALSITSIEVSPIQHRNEAIQLLSKEIPSSPATIERRLMLLVLPSEVQIMIEQDSILLGVAEIISRLRSIEDETIRSKYMLRLAHDFKGETPNLGKLKQEVETIKETYDLQKTKKNKELKEYEKAVEQKKNILITNLEDIVRWYNKKFSKDLKPDIKNASEIISILQDKGHNLTTDTSFENLTNKQSKLEGKRDRLLSNLKIVKNEHLDTCPFCGAYVRASVINKNISLLEDDLEQISKDKRNLSELANEIEKMREDLRKANMDYENALDTFNSLKGEGDDG